jgi:hypothetical protein
VARILLYIDVGVTVTIREGGRDDHSRTRSDFRNPILRRASRDLYIFTWAVTANCLCLRMGRTLEKMRFPSTKFLAEKFFEEFLLSKLIHNAVVDDSRSEGIGSNAFHLIEFQQDWNRP